MASIKKEFIYKITDRQRRDGSDLLDVITSFTGKPKREGSSYKTSTLLKKYALPSL